MVTYTATIYDHSGVNGGFGVPPVEQTEEEYIQA